MSAEHGLQRNQIAYRGSNVTVFLAEGYDDLEA